MTTGSLDIALVHHLPPAGGAMRVIAEYAVRRPDHSFTVYTRMPEPRAGEVLVSLPEAVAVRRRALPEPRTRIGRMRALLDLPAHGRALAAEIDAAGHDVAFVHASTLVQAHEVLPHLRTPCVAYAPEPLRSRYEPAARGGSRVRRALVAAGLDPYERIRARLDRAHIRAAARVVTHSHFTAGELRRIYGVEPDVVELGVDADALAADPAQQRERLVLSVGALHPLKGHQDVIEALGTVRRGERPRLVVVGDRGEMAEELQALAAARCVELDLRRAIPFEELAGLYRRAGAVACAQVAEPFGLVALEAMAAGAPVVAVAEGGFLETVRDGVTGLHVPRDHAALGAMLLRVLDDPGLAERIREAALRDVRARWAWERTARGYDALLLRAAASSAARPA